MDDPRPHHYEFAHRALPALATRFAADLDRWRTDDLQGLLRDLWDRAGERVPERTDPDGLRGEVVTVGGHDALLVTLPEPRGMTEAYYVAIVATDPPRVVTLEWTRGVADGAVGTVVGEWAEQTHYNGGPGPAPERDAFLEEVARRVVSRGT